MVGTFPAAEGAEPCEGDVAPLLLRACPVREGRSLADEGEQTEAYEEAKLEEINANLLFSHQMLQMLMTSHD